MTDSPKDEGPSQPDATGEQLGKESDPVGRYTRILLAVVVFLFVWYVWADRVVPWTDQARVDGFIVAITPKISGRVVEVNVIQDQLVEAGDVLVLIDPRQYELAVASAKADLEIAGQETGAETAGVAAAEANLADARAQRLKAEQNYERLERIHEEDPGAVSETFRDNARAAKDSTVARVASASAELEKAKETLGVSGNENPKVRAAIAALQNAHNNLADTQLFAPSNGGITNLEVQVGHYANAGQPLMTFVSGSGVWIEAYLRENNLANIKPGDPVDIVLDMVPGRIWKGSVQSKGYAVQKPTKGSPGGLVTVKTSSGWLRDAQRFPVIIKFDDQSARGYRFLGGQADVQIYTQESNAFLNALGQFWIRLMSWLSYVY
jgi:multidrug resistance efflux pump